MPSKQLKRQIAFIYLIAFYQDDYKAFEGECFYIEGYLDEELTIDGPTYLFDATIGGTYPHEQILYFAKKVLKGEKIRREEVTGDFASLLNEAMKFLKE